MKFTSTRNSELQIPFSRAVFDCISEDGGVLVPSEIEDLRRWIYYIDEKTSFSSVAGTLTSALIKDEFSPIICENIATKAFPDEPVVRQLDDGLFMMELFHGFTGHHKDYGVSYLCSYLETTLQLQGKKAVLLDFTHHGLGAVLAKALRGKKNIKAVIVYQKGTAIGLEDSDFVWNGGNIYPVEMTGSEQEIRDKINKVFADKDFVEKYSITTASTINVCRMLGEIFFYPYSFAKIKNKVDGDIYYSIDADHYGSLMAGLYSWRFALPLSGFFIPSTPALYRDNNGICVEPNAVRSSFGEDKTISLPANLERLKAFFGTNELMMRNFVIPVPVTKAQTDDAARELYNKYGVFADWETARSYAAVRNNLSEILEDEGALVLMSSNHPALYKDYCKEVLGCVPELPENVKKSAEKVELTRPLISSVEDIKEIIRSL